MIKVLKIVDFKKIAQLLEDADVFNNNLSYVSPYIYKSQLSDMLIKRSMFNYEKFFIESKLDSKNLVSFKVNKFPSVINMLYIETVIDLSDKNLKSFLDLSIKEIQTKFKNKNGISIYVESKESTKNFLSILDELDFEQELLLKNELGEGNDVLLLTKYI